MYVHECELFMMQTDLHQSAFSLCHLSVFVILGDDARNSNKDKRFQFHHPKSMNLGAVKVRFFIKYLY